MTIEQHAAGTGLAVTSEQDWWSEKQLAALNQLGLGNVPPGDLGVFLHQCQRTGLDPFLKQIHLVMRQGRGTIQTGIDGYRLIARRAVDAAGETLGMLPQEWCGPDGVWKDVWLSDEPPAAARYTVVRNGQNFSAIALFSEYAAFKKSGELNTFWASKPALMLSKCAEALALRRAFPADLSGLYTAEEMAQAENPAQADVPAPPPSAKSPADEARQEQYKQIVFLMSRVGIPENAETRRQIVAETINRQIDSVGDCTDDELSRVVDFLARWQEQGHPPAPETEVLPVEAEIIEE